jgi:hypothetical protein
MVTHVRLHVQRLERTAKENVHASENVFAPMNGTLFAEWIELLIKTLVKQNVKTLKKNAKVNVLAKNVLVKNYLTQFVELMALPIQISVR